MIGNVIAIAVIVLVVGAAVAYIVKAKRSGQKCVGCPYSKSCGSTEKCTCSNKNTKNK